MRQRERNFYGTLKQGKDVEPLLAWTKIKTENPDNKTPEELDELLKRMILAGEARRIAEKYANHSVVDDIKWLSRQKNRDQLIAALEYLKQHLPKLSELLDDDPDMPFIGVVRGQLSVELPAPPDPVAIKAECRWIGKAHRYLTDEHGLDQILNFIKTTKWPNKWQWRTRAIKSAVWEIQYIYREQHIEMPPWEEIGDMIIEVFELERPNDVTDWIRQLASRD